MLEVEAINLIRVEKEIVDERIRLPKQNEAIMINAISKLNPNHKFILDVNRKMAIISRCTYQQRIYTTIPLIRLDIDTKPHTNPDDEKIVGTHMHIYKDGYNLTWAYPLDHDYLREINPTFDLSNFRNSTSVAEFFTSFCLYCNILKLPLFQVPI